MIVPNLSKHLYNNVESTLSMKFTKPVVTVDTALFGYHKNSLNILLVKRRNDPYKGKWVLPGGFIKVSETLEDSALRELREETGVKDVHVEQLHAFGAPSRDPRGRAVTIAFYGVVNFRDVKAKPGSDAKQAKWFSVDKLPELGFDHKSIADMATLRLRENVDRLGFRLVSSMFTLTELQQLHEAVLGKPLDKRNFRKRLFALDAIVETSRTKMEGAHRPARLYKVR